MSIQIAILILLVLLLVFLVFILINKSTDIPVTVDPVVTDEFVQKSPYIPPLDWDFRYMSKQVPVLTEEVVLPPIRRLVRRFGHMHRRMRQREDDHQFEDIMATVRNAINQPDFRVEILEDRPRSPSPTALPGIRPEPEVFFDNLVQHQNDGQNVHDSNIRKDLTKKMLRMIELNKQAVTAEELGVTEDQYIKDKLAQTAHEIKRRAAEYYNGLILRESDREKGIIIRGETDLKLSKLEIVLDKINNGFTLVMANGVIYREDYLLNIVWDRINSEDNISNREQLQIALIDNLVDCVYRADTNLDEAFAQIVQMITGDMYITVCINGRVARFITSLVLLDNDEIISTPEKDIAEVANEAYSKAHVTLNLEYSKLTVEQQALFGEDMDDLTEEQQQEVKAMENKIKKEIANVLTQDYREIISEEKLAEIITKAQAGV